MDSIFHTFKGYDTCWLYSSHVGKLLPLTSLTLVSGANLQYKGIVLDSPSNVTLTVGGQTRQRVLCVRSEDKEQGSTLIEWYNPQGQLVSRDGGDEVNQAAVGRFAILNFLSYQYSQGGKYRCRVTGPGNNTKTLSICIGECHTWDSCSLCAWLYTCLFVHNFSLWGQLILFTYIYVYNVILARNRTEHEKFCRNDVRPALMSEDDWLHSHNLYRVLIYSLKALAAFSASMIP